jgi:DNA-binding response OmpR family regulator
MCPHLLLVEDELVLQRNLRRALERQGYTLTGVTTGAAVWPVLRQAPVALVLLDLGLPDLDGLMLLLRRRTQYPQIPVLVMTGQDARAAQAYALGAAAFLPKPFALAQLWAAIAGLLGPYPANRERPSGLPAPCQEPYP